MCQNINHRFLQIHAVECQRFEFAHHALHIAQHFGRFAQQYFQRHVDSQLGFRRSLRIARQTVTDFQVALLRNDADHRKWRAFTHAKGFKQRQRLRRYRHHIALLAFIAPNFFRCHASFFQRNFAQVKTRATARVVHQFRESVGDTARTHIVDRQNRVRITAQPALVNDFLRAALNLGVAALYRIKIQRGAICTRRHRASSAATHADAHARAAQLHQERACWEFNFVRQACVDRADAARNHDGLVVAALHARNLLLVSAEVARQHGATKLVAKSGRAQRTFGHDL